MAEYNTSGVEFESQLGGAEPDDQIGDATLVAKIGRGAISSTVHLNYVRGS
jgi:hypothetical protein